MRAVVDPQKRLTIHLGIDLGRGKARMAEQFLYDAQVGAIAQKLVAKDVGVRGGWPFQAAQRARIRAITIADRGDSLPPSRR